MCSEIPEFLLKEVDLIRDSLISGDLELEMVVCAP